MLVDGEHYPPVVAAAVARLRDTKAPISDNNRMPFSGSTQQLIEDVETYRALGVSHLSFDFRRPTLTETMDRMEWFATEVMAKTGRPDA